MREGFRPSLAELWGSGQDPRLESIVSWIERWRTKAKPTDPLVEDVGKASVYFSKVTFSDGTEIQLQSNSILVLTGPNNAGKSSALRQLRTLIEDGAFRPVVLESAELSKIGSEADFRNFIKANTLPGPLDTVKVGSRDYSLSEISRDFQKSFAGSKVAALLHSFLDAGERLSISSPARREDNLYAAPRHPMQWLDIDCEAEEKVSSAFEKTFGSRLVLNRLAGENLVLNVTKDPRPQNIKENSRDHAQWMSSLPRLHRQGDGMRTFAGMLMSLLVTPRSILLVDEPEAFLHPPQVRRLAETMVEASLSCQIVVATHSDEFVRALLDHSGDRVTVARIQRVGDKNPTSVLSSSEVVKLWVDPLLRTSDVLSSLFHEAAIICEGETDARFFRAMLDASKSDQRKPDVRFYHFGGKDRIASIASALRAIKVPVVAVVDIDALSSTQKYITLYESLGGRADEIKEDLVLLNRAVNARKGQLDARELITELKRIVGELEAANAVSTEVRGAIGDLARSANNWQKVKEAGHRALGDAPLIQAFERIRTKSKGVGILLNREGELEGFYRQISRKNKSEWLAAVLQSDLYSDPALSDARDFIREMKSCIEDRIVWS
jgi:energy-coupling factor transporter ATP-binding protein EcfA2